MAHWLWLLLTLGAMFLPATAVAGPIPAQAASAPVPSGPDHARRGVAVVAADGATDAAWSLARGIYADPDLRPALDERRARVLAGEGAPDDDTKELAELRAGVKGNDAASRQLLASIAEKVRAMALVFVRVEDGGRSTARTFVPESGSFAAAVFVGEPAPADVDGAWSGSDKARWPGAVASLHKDFAPPQAPAPPPVAAVPAKRKDEKASGKPFYLSPWFWGAVGAAVLGGLAIFLATRDAESDAIRLQVRLPQ